MNNKSSWLKKAVVLCIVLGTQAVYANKTVDIHQLNDDASKKGIGEKIGTVTFSDSEKGLEINTDLTTLTAGGHGFHIHENPHCEGAVKDGKWVAGTAAGSHLDPEHTGHHLGPEGKGHLGDLPLITANAKGESKEHLVAPRLKVADLSGHSVMIHKGSDNYSDVPPMGGGGDRVACGVIH